MSRAELTEHPDERSEDGPRSSGSPGSPTASSRRDQREPGEPHGCRIRRADGRGRARQDV